MSRSYRERLDPEDEAKNLVTALGYLDTPVGRGLGRLLGVDREALNGIRGAKNEYDRLVAGPEQIAEYLSPLGWIAGPGPVDKYLEAAELAAEGDGEAAERLLVEAWNRDGGSPLRSYAVRIMSLYRDDDSREIGRFRRELIDEALQNHADGRYGSAVAMLLTQIDGIVFDMTGKDAKTFFAGARAKHLEDDETLAGHPEGLKVLSRLFSKDQRETLASGDLRRHAIVHGREVAFGTLRNSTKVFVALFSVIDWAQPLARERDQALREAREERFKGSSERDEFGHRLDRRGFDEVKAVLHRAAQWQFGHFKRGARYARTLDELDPFGKLERPQLSVHASRDGAEFRIWAETDSGLTFGIGGRDGDFPTWRYVGDAAPPEDLEAKGWEHELEGDPDPDW